MDPEFPPSVLQRLASEATDPTDVAGGIVGPIGFELRQISGLTAGAAHSIASGGISYTTEAGVDGFRLDADADGAIVITPLDLPVRLDNRLIDGPRHVDEALVDVGFACFRVASRRPSIPHPPGTRAPQDRSLERRPPVDAEVVVPTSGIEERDLLRLVGNEYDSALKRARAMWPDPEEIMFNLFEEGPLVWSQRGDDPAFGHVAVALGTVPWQPRLTRPMDMSPSAFDEIKSRQSLPAVPIVANLNLGPVGLVGSRDKTLAIARQIVLHRSVLSPPRSLAVGIVSNRQTVGDWGWIRPLPHLERLGTKRRPLRVLDDPVNPDQVADIIIVEDAEQLPKHCAMTVIVGEDARCTVIDVDGDDLTMAATPLGLHPRLAEAGVKRLAELHEAHPTIGAADEPTTRTARSPIGAAPAEMGYESSFF